MRQYRITIERKGKRFIFTAFYEEEKMFEKFLLLMHEDCTYIQLNEKK